MRLALLAAAALVVALSAGPAGAAAPCSVAAAKQALKGKKGPWTAGQVDAVICFDFTRDGRLDMAATVFSGGTAGEIAWVAFRGTPSGWRVALARGGYKLGLVRAGGDLVQTQPVYRKNDPNCCPTGGFDHDRWHWDGTRFVVVRHWHDRRFRP